MDVSGLEILHSVVKADLQSKLDCLVAALHMILINKGNRCAGTGDDWPEDSTSALTELLPEGWNSNQEVYTLRYISRSSGIKYLVKYVKAGNCLLVNMFNVNEEKASGMSVTVDNHVADDFSGFSGMYKNLDDLSQSFQAEILQKVQPSASQSCNPTSSSENRSQKSNMPQNDGRDPLSSDRSRPHVINEPQRVNFPSVGRGDLDPLGGGYGGGMLLDPLGMGRPSPQFGIGGPGSLPRSAVPPGARFDPFGPPMPGRGPSYPSNPDHLPPPGFDDAFM